MDAKMQAALDSLSDEERNVLRAYLVFSNGDGLTVLDDLMEVFYFFQSDAFNEELQEYPHPQREYVKAGCRMVMDKIKIGNKLAEETR